QSNGAGAAWNLLTNAPDRFAAAVLVAPMIGNNAGAADVSRMPVWIFQGDAAEALPGAARALVTDMKRAGGKPSLTEYPRVGHDCWTRAFADPGLVSWLFSQHR